MTCWLDFTYSLHRKLHSGLFTRLEDWVAKLFKSVELVNPHYKAEKATIVNGVP
jgi:hypothetical protein